jgi:hypothetical protein
MMNLIHKKKTQKMRYIDIVDLKIQNISRGEDGIMSLELMIMILIFLNIGKQSSVNSQLLLK